MAEGRQPTSVVVTSTVSDACEVLARLVEAAGHRAVRAAEPEEVVEAVVRKGADAVLLDAGSLNLQVVQALRSQGEPLGAELRIVSVEVGPASARLAWDAGVDAVLTRPFPAGEVGDALHAALERSDAERTAERQRQATASAS